MGHFTRHLYQQPESIQKLVKKIVDELQPIKILLFGSRARGEHRDSSDFDIACIFKIKNQEKWTEIMVNLHEEPLTLWPVDLVDFSELSNEYKQNIQREGILLYG